MILKILLIIGVITFIYLVFIKAKPSKDSLKKEKEVPKTNDMVECCTCNVYVEITECILSNGKYYCSTECLSEAK